MIIGTNVIIGSFALNFNHKGFIRSKEGIVTPTKTNFLILIADVINVSTLIGSKMAPYTKASKIQVIKGLSNNTQNLFYSNDVIRQQAST